MEPALIQLKLIEFQGSAHCKIVKLVFALLVRTVNAKNSTSTGNIFQFCCVQYLINYLLT